MYIEGMSSFRTQTMDFQLDVYFQQFWRDPRLAHNESRRVLVKDKAVLHKMWHPDVYFANARIAEFHEVDPLRLQPRLLASVFCRSPSRTSWCGYSRMVRFSTIPGSQWSWCVLWTWRSGHWILSDVTCAFWAVSWSMMHNQFDVTTSRCLHNGTTGDQVEGGGADHQESEHRHVWHAHCRFVPRPMRRKLLYWLVWSFE